MLNQMGEESFENWESETERCRVYRVETLLELDRLRDLVLYYNAKAAEARGRVIEAQGIIITTSEELQRTREALFQLKIECARDIKLLEEQLRVVLQDIEVMANVLEMTDCNDKLMLIECKHCGGAVLVQHGKVQ